MKFKIVIEHNIIKKVAYFNHNIHHDFESKLLKCLAVDGNINRVFGYTIWSGVKMKLIK